MPDNAMGKMEKEQAHSVILMEKFCAVSNKLGSVLVEKGSCVLMKGQLWALEDTEKANKHGMGACWKTKSGRELC